MKETNIMRTIITSLLLLLLCSDVFAQKQVMKAVNATKAYAKPLPVAALNRATTLEALGNTFTERNTAVQFVADKAVLKQMEKLLNEKTLSLLLNKQRRNLKKANIKLLKS